ncbi:hypothetical protein Gogos_012020 [Gossypium gossypioides]|uniref:Uncharacterized protein n=1 Tax=Gossypium gossypioides TaxID=34282 RepID=A0A7J9BR76_GOSGO|nr:hypothetical protein [Gossypium gossypioides]
MSVVRVHLSLTRELSRNKTI